MTNYIVSVLQRCPDMGPTAAAHRAARMKEVEAMSNTELLALTPSVGDALELVKYQKIPLPMRFMTYGEIAKYYWALDNAEDFGAFLTLRGVPLYERPENSDNYILPSTVTSFIWAAMRAGGVVTFDDLRAPIEVRRRAISIPSDFKAACAERGYMINTKKAWGYQMWLTRCTELETYEPYVSIGKRVHDMRVISGRSVDEVAAGTGVSSATIRLLEVGALKTLSVESLMAIAAYFQATPNDLCIKQ